MSYFMEFLLDEPFLSKIQFYTPRRNGQAVLALIKLM